MTEQHLLGACPLLSSGGDLSGLQLPLPEVRRRVDDDPRNSTAKVYDLHTTRKRPHKIDSNSVHTSWSKKLARPVARMGLPIQRYHAAHCVSSQLSFVKSVFAYSKLASETVEFTIFAGRGGGGKEV